MSIALILASKSKPRRDVLFSAGVCPTIRVSHVDEPHALQEAAERDGVHVDDLSVEQQVMILARAKAMAVYDSYRQTLQTAREARGNCVIGYPLKAQGVFGEENINDGIAQTRDFSGVQIPTQQEPLDAHVLRNGLGSAAVGPLILGCDSMFLMDGAVYGKPHCAQVARERLHAMSGSSGQLWTGHCLIDMASGHIVMGASKAVLHFSQLTDRDIEAYIATGEPLEVAGSFTLEGLGGPFIDAIEGDPSGIIGLSLPLVRRLTGELGIDWIDLWNTDASGNTDTVVSDNKSAPTAVVPPVENVHQPGDGWVDCLCGRRHWGTNGAAGVLLARRDPHTGMPTAIVMQHRAVWSAEGGTWGIPGGAIADGENAIEGALRESFEEANITPQDIEVVGAYTEDHGNWSYTTVFAFEKPEHEVHPHANDDESMEIEWVPIEEVPNHKLLTAMRTDWPKFVERLNELAKEEQA